MWHTPSGYLEHRVIPLILAASSSVKLSTHQLSSPQPPQSDTEMAQQATATGEMLNFKDLVTVITGAGTGLGRV